MKKGWLEQKENQIRKLRKDLKFKKNEFDYIKEGCPFEAIKRGGNEYLKSKIFNIEMMSFEKEIDLEN